ncbi:MAG: oligosaccharide flippase family protein [Rubrivivax sp.]
MSFKKKLMAGVGYTAGGQLITYGVRFIGNLVLARLLAPDLFGLMLVGYTFTYAASLLTDIGSRSAIIQDARADDSNYRDSVWTMYFLRGIVVALFVSAMTGFIWYLQSMGFVNPTSTYADPRLLLVLPLLALAEFIRCFESIEVLYRERVLDFRALFIFNGSKQFVNTFAAIVWAWLDPGVVGLCAGGIIAQLFGAVLSYSWMNGQPPKLVWRPDDFLYILQQGKWVLVSSGLTFLVNSADRVIMALQLDAVQMGLYSMALTLGLLAQDFAYKLGTTVVFPGISHRIREGVTDVSRDYYRMRRLFEYLAIGSGFTLILLGNEIIELLYPAQYGGAGPVLQVLGFVALLVAYMPSQDAYAGMGEFKKASLVNLVRLVSMVLALLVLVPALGIVGGAWSLVVSALCSTLAMFWCNHLLGLLRWREELRLLSWFAIGFVVAGAVEAWRRGMF